MTAFQSDENSFKYYLTTVVPGFRVLGFSALPGFRAQKSGDGVWSVHKTLFGFRAPLSKLTIKKISLFYTAKSQILSPKLTIFSTKLKNLTNSFVGNGQKLVKKPY